MISLTLPLRTPNVLNGSHGHWAKKAGMRRAHRHGTRLALEPKVRPGLRRFQTLAGPAEQWEDPFRRHGMSYEPTPLVVTVTRIAPSRGLDPHDGLGAALKGVIDGVADALGVDDRDPRVTWELRQERGPWGVRVEVRAR